MKEFAKLAGREYVPNFEEALTDGSTKMAKRMLADLSAHFDQVVQSFGDVVTKFESAARCINVAAPQRARNFTITGTAVAMIAAAFVTLITAYYLEASAFTLCALAAVFAILTMGCRAMANTDANRSARQQGMCDHFANSMWQVKSSKLAKRVLADLSVHLDRVVAVPQGARSLTIIGTTGAMTAAACGTLITAYYFEASAFKLYALAAVFAILIGCRAMATTDASRNAHQQGMCDSFADTMRQVNAIVAKHTEELQTSQSSLKALVTDDTGALKRLVDDWQRDDDGKEQLKKGMERVRSQFNALEDDCLGWTQALSG
eukprot:UN0929